jgi:hypothetical protein
MELDQRLESVYPRKQAHAWKNQHMRRNRRTVLYSGEGESRYILKFVDCRIRPWRWPEERFVCIMPVDHFGGDSLMVW